MAKRKYTYILSPVAYDESGHEQDRAYDPMTFASRKEADDFINDMGSRWVLYPNIEIYRVAGDGKYFSKDDLKFVAGYDEGGEYKMTSLAAKAKRKTKKAKRGARTSTGVKGLRR